MNKAAIAIIVASLWVITYGAAFADFQRDPSLVDTAAERCRHDMAFAAGWALFPPAWVMAPFVTGFWEHGLKFSCSREPQSAEPQK